MVIEDRSRREQSLPRVPLTGIPPGCRFYITEQSLSVSPCLLYTLSYTPFRMLGYTDGRPQIERRPGPYQGWLLQDFGTVDPVDWRAPSAPHRVAFTTTASDLPGRILSAVAGRIALDDFGTDEGRKRDERLQSWVLSTFSNGPRGPYMRLVSLFNRDWVLKVSIDGRLLLDSLARPQTPVDGEGLCYMWRLDPIN